MVPLFMLIVSMWLVRLPVAVWFGHDYGEEAIWWSFPVGAIVSLVLSSTYYRFGGWRRARMEIAAA